MTQLHIRRSKSDIHWDKKYAELAVLVAKGLDANLPQKHTPLGEWLSNQRECYNQGKLAPRRTELLEGLGVKWRLNSTWLHMYLGLEAIVKAGGDANALRGHKKYSNWLSSQRAYYMQGKLPRRRIVLLEGLGVKWISNRPRLSWLTTYLALKTIVKAGGDANVLSKHATHGGWLNNQRTAYKQGKLERRKILLLERLGVRWSTPHIPWIKRYLCLKQYVQAVPDANVSQKHPIHGTWLNNQRIAYREGKLERRKILLLERLGVKWSTRNN